MGGIKNILYNVYHLNSSCIFLLAYVQLRFMTYQPFLGYLMLNYSVLIGRHGTGFCRCQKGKPRYGLNKNLGLVWPKGKR